MSALPQSCDVAIVGAGAAGLATAIFVRALSPTRSVVLLDGARKPGAKILVSGGARCNVTNTVVTERDFWGGRAGDHPPGAARVSRRRHRRVLPRDRRRAARGSRRQAVSRHEPRARRARRAAARSAPRVGATLVPGHRVIDVARSPTPGSASSPTRGALHAPRSCSRRAGGRCPRPAATAPATRSRSASATRSCRRRPRSRRCVLDAAPVDSHAQLSGVSHDVELAVWVDGAIAVRLTRRAAVDAFRRQRSGGAERVAPLAARAARGPATLSLTAQPLSRAALRRRRRATGMRLASVNPRSSVQRRSPRCLPASVAAALLRSSAIDAPPRWRTSRATIGAGCRTRWSSGRCRSPTRAATTTPKPRPAASR